MRIFSLRICILDKLIHLSLKNFTYIFTTTSCSKFQTMLHSYLFLSFATLVCLMPILVLCCSRLPILVLCCSRLPILVLYCSCILYLFLSFAAVVCVTCPLLQAFAYSCPLLQSLAYSYPSLQSFAYSCPLLQSYAYCTRTIFFPLCCSRMHCLSLAAVPSCIAVGRPLLPVSCPLL
jgi:hypothetical protein